MKRVPLPLLALAVACALVLPSAARAVLVTVNFSALADPSDPTYAGQTATGSFSFESALIPSGGGPIVDSNGLGISSLAFTWAGHTWSTADAGCTYLNFTTTGTLFRWGLGGAPSGFGVLAFNDFPDFLASTSSFLYSTSDSPTSRPSGGYYGIFIGTVQSWSIASASVPEPGTLSLLGVGLLPLGLIRRRRKDPRAPSSYANKGPP